MSSLVNLGLAAVAGFAVGAGATVAFSPSSPKSVTKRSSRDIEPLPIESTPNKVGAIPGVEVYNGLLTGTELVKRSLTVGQVGPISDFLVRQAYTTAYDRRNRIPAWTAEHLTASSLKGFGDRKDVSFREDEEIPDRFRAKLLDYFRSGYDRGHMVPAADAKQNQSAMAETFLLTNIAPQVGEGFNRHYWAYLESFCRSLTAQFEDVYVFTVPLFLPRKSPDGKWRVTYEMIAAANNAPTIAVPTHFAKVLIASRPPRSHLPNALVSKTSSTLEKEWAMGAFVLPNEPIPDETRLENFIVPVEAVESSSGLTLFPDELKRLARPLCSTVKCEVVVRRFDDAQKQLGGGRPKPKRRETM